MPVSLANSLVVYEELKKCGIGLVSDLAGTLTVPLSRPFRQARSLAAASCGVAANPQAHVGGRTGMHHPGNLVYVIFGNESPLSVDGFPTATGSDLAAAASASGIPHTQTVRTVEEFTHAFDEALHRNDMSCTAAKVEALGQRTRHRSGITRKSLSIQTAH